MRKGPTGDLFDQSLIRELVGGGVRPGDAFNDCTHHTRTCNVCGE